jgi:uncharacterized protein YbaP (TraB family)
MLRGNWHIFNTESLLIYKRNMMRWLTLLILLRFSPEVRGQDENALLWRISGKDLAQPSYLYGTIHMICPEDMKLGDSLRNSVANCERLFLEIDMDAPGMMMKTMKMSMLSSGSIRDLMTKPDYTRLESFMKDSLGMPMLLLNKMKPFTLMSLMYAKLLPCNKPASYEESLMKMAKKQEKEIMGLESIEDQMAVFDQIPDSMEIRMLMALIDDFQGQRDEFARMINAYLQKDLQQLGKMIGDAPDIDGFEDLLLVNRNKRWIPIISAEIKKSPSLFAVGAGHLPGPDGVIELLRKEGFIVSPVE